LPSDTITSNTSVYEMGVYAWNLSQGDAMDDRALLATLVKRLKYLRISAAEALSQCVREPRIGQGDPCQGRGVEKNAMVAFCHQLLLSITERRAAQFLRGELCGAVDGSGEVGPIASVPRFLALFGEGRANGVAVNARKAGKNDRIAPVKRDIRVNPLSEHERVLLTRLRESLFERHAKMKSMFESLDPNGDGFVTIEEFLHALTRAGVAITGEIDRRAASVSADEAAHLLAFFDRDGDGCLEYNEFMRLLQDSKHQVMASAEISKAGVGQIMPRARAQPVDARDQLLESAIDIS